MTTAVLSAAPLPEVLPVHEDGTPFAFAAFLGENIIMGDSRTDIVAGIIDGYGDIPDTEEGHLEALVARYEFAVGTADIHQQIIAAEKLNSGEFDHTVEDEGILTSIFSSRRERQPEMASWDHPVPLVLVGTDYAPYTTLPRPEGNVQWIDPYNETTLLASLAALDLIELHVHQDD
jgi:hypothetical protein